MNMHDHRECKHNLKHCPVCDVVYCTRCKKEWGGHQHWYWAYPIITYTTEYILGGQSIDTGTADGITYTIDDPVVDTLTAGHDHS